jgi:hypothetical protein
MGGPSSKKSSTADKLGSGPAATDSDDFFSLSPLGFDLDPVKSNLLEGKEEH